MDPWWYNIVTGKVEHGPGAPNSQRLGPFDTEAEAANALELARKRNESWAEQDRQWNGEPDNPKAPTIY